MCASFATNTPRVVIGPVRKNHTPSPSSETTGNARRTPTPASRKPKNATLRVPSTSRKRCPSTAALAVLTK